MKDLSQFVSEKNGKLSGMRLALFIYLVPVIAAWAFISFSKKELQPLDSSLITGLGLLIGGKTVSRYAENPAKTPVIESPKI